MILNTEKQQLNKMRVQAIRRISLVDLNLSGNDVTTDEEFIKLGYQAIKNKVLFWLNSVLGDVVRSSQASPLIDMLGKRITDANRFTYETNFRISFEEAFSSDNIKLSQVNLEMDASKTLYINLLIKDNITDSLIPINLEVIQ